MARSVSVGFVLTAKDAASTTFGAAGKGITGALSGMQGGFHLLRTAMRDAHLVLNILKSTLIDWVKEALKFQSSGVREQFTEFGKSIELVRARLGDAFIPVLQAFMTVLSPVLKGMQDWLVANNKLIAGKALEWSVAIGRVLVDVVLYAVVLVAKAWAGWLEIIDVVRAGIDKFVGVVLSGFDELLQGAAAIANALGFRDQAIALTQYHEKVAALAVTWSGAGDDALRSAQMQVQKLNLLETKVQDVDEAARQAFDQIWAVGLQKISVFAVGATKSIKDLAEAQKQADEAKRKADAAAKLAFEEHKRQMMELMRVADQYGQTLGNVLAQIAMGSMRTKDAFKALAKSMIADLHQVAIRAIESYAVSSAGAAYFSQAGIPVIGPILAVAAASAAFAFVEAYMTKFAAGGFVPGSGNRDSVPSMLTPGEYVMSKDEVKHGRARWQSGGGDVNITLRQESFVPDSEAAFESKSRVMLRTVQGWLDRGQLKLRTT